MSSSPRNRTEPTAQRLTTASCQTLVSCWDSVYGFPQDATCLHRAQRLLGLVTAPSLDASAIREFVDSLVTEVETRENDTLAEFAEAALESLCLLELHPPSEERAILRRVLAARVRVRVSYYRLCVEEGPRPDQSRNALRRSVEVLDLIRADPPRFAELQRLKHTMWQEACDEDSQFLIVIWLAARALKTLGRSEGARLRELVWEFDLEDPPGAFYALRQKDEPVGLPLAGFFVHRLTGRVRHVRGSELWTACPELHPSRLRRPLPENRGGLQLVVQHLLTRRSVLRGPVANASPGDGSGDQWWQFWK